jgi:hypothetical protein
LPHFPLKDIPPLPKQTFCHSQARRRRHCPGQTTQASPRPDHAANARNGPAATDQVGTPGRQKPTALNVAPPTWVWMLPAPPRPEHAANSRVGTCHRTLLLLRINVHPADGMVGPKATPRFGPTPDLGGGCEAAPWTGVSRAATPQWLGVAAQGLGWPSGQP